MTPHPRCSPAALTVLLACGAAQPQGAPEPSPAAITAVLAAGDLLPLEIAGVTPTDTTVTFATGRDRKVILRHGPPDNTVFVELFFPAGGFGASPAESVTVSVHPSPGLYGLTLATSQVPGPGARIRFKYPVHFGAPLAGLTRYGSPARYEQALVILRQLENGRWGRLPTTRPATDNLEAALGAAGTFLVAAPR